MQHKITIWIINSTLIGFTFLPVACSAAAKSSHSSGKAAPYTRIHITASGINVWSYSEVRVQNDKVGIRMISSTHLDIDLLSDAKLIFDNGQVLNLKHGKLYANDIRIGNCINIFVTAKGIEENAFIPRF